MVRDYVAWLDAAAVILVEGTSDRIALQVLAERQGRDLAADGVHVVPMGGATNIGRFLVSLAPLRPGLTVAGLYDAAEEPYIRRGLERFGFGSDLATAELESLGFYACVTDLEDELIRAVGVAGVERIIEAEGELASLRLLQQQPAQRRRSATQHLHRFIGVRSGRKDRYAHLLAAAVDLTRAPRPLDAVLAHVIRGLGT